ncbi:hypothetical protein QTP86_004889 [Hemibagrus guttatus]|nr:hypothetical protein QTP86_004889 [Hemibagrus guttatus]
MFMFTMRFISVKESSVEPAKSNPSKRHRDRLNGELDRLASLLPFHQDVITKLDKLTVLRLSVGCLRAKSHFSSVLKTSSSNQPANIDAKTHVQELPEVTENSQLLHTYYNPEQLPPENSAFLERNFMCRLRCLLNNSSGFLAMNLQGRLKFLHGQNEKTPEGKPIPPQLALFALACPIQPPSILEIRAKNFFFKTKHKLDFTPIGCDAKGKIVLGYTEAELCYRGSGYQFIHAADMLYCAENHIRMIKTGDEEGEETLKKRSLMLPFSFTTGEAVLYDMSFSGTPSGSEPIASVAPGDSNQQKLPRGLDPNSLLGSMLKQDESLYVCPSGSDEPKAQDPEEEEDLGGIFSSNWQKNVVSLPETPFFKPDPAISSGGEESNCELMSLMGSLGITPADLELLQQEELFLNIELDGRYGFEEFTDDVLSYVQDSLRKKVDFVLPSSVQSNMEEKRLPQHQPPSQPPLIPWSQDQQLFLQSPLLSQSQQQCLSFLDKPSEPKMPQFIPKQSYSQFQQSTSMQDSQQTHKGTLQAQTYQQPRLTQPGLQMKPQQQSSHPVNYKHVYQPELSCFFRPEKEVYYRVKHTEVNGSDSVPVTESSSNSERLPAVLQSGLQQPGSFYLETNHLPQGLPYMNQLNTVSMNCNQEFAPSYSHAGNAHVGEYVGELLTCLDTVGQEKHGQFGELHGGSQPLCAQSSLDHSMLQQPYVGQNGAHGNLQESFEEEGIGGLAAQPPQCSSGNRPYPDLSLGYM